MIKSHTGSYTCALERQLPDSDASFFWDTSDSKKKEKGTGTGSSMTRYLVQNASGTEGMT